MSTESRSSRSHGETIFVSIASYRDTQTLGSNKACSQSSVGSPIMLTRAKCLTAGASTQSKKRGSIIRRDAHTQRRCFESKGLQIFRELCPELHMQDVTALQNLAWGGGGVLVARGIRQPSLWSDVRSVGCNVFCPIFTGAVFAGLATKSLEAS